MATVHLGRLVGDEGFGRTVAIKRLRPHCATDPRIVLAFLDEAWLATRVRHPNVVSTLDVVTEPGEVYLVMDYVEGEALSTLVKASRRARVPPGIVVAIVAGVLRGLGAAHEAVSESGEPLDLIHRDVSPQNILVGVDGIPRLLDFGVAKALGRRQSTRNRELKGKLAYMSPEQLTGGEVTQRTDLFAVGIVLWELLAGRRLFRGEHEGQTITRTLLAPLVPPSTIAPYAPAVLDAIVMRALERDPSKRFASAMEMVHALEAAMVPASMGIVGEWVKSVARESLQDRANQVRAIEIRSRLENEPPPKPEKRWPFPKPDKTFVPPAPQVDVGEALTLLRTPRLNVPGARDRRPQADAGDANQLPNGSSVSIRPPILRSRFRWVAAVAVAAVVVAGTEGVALLRGAPSRSAPAAAQAAPPVSPPRPAALDTACTLSADDPDTCSLPPPAAPSAPSKSPAPALKASPSARPGIRPLPLYGRE
jgi:serine/threonine-protein kinase